MRRIAFWTGIAVIAVGCQQAPVVKPRILSVQSPQGMPPAPPLKTSRTNPLIVPTAPVGVRTAVVAPQVGVAIPQPPPGVIAQPVPIPVPAAPGPQGVMPPNTFAQPPLQYTPPAGASPATIGGASSLKPPERLPGPVSDTLDASKQDNQ